MTDILTLMDAVIFDGVGISFSNFIILITVFGSMLFMAYNFRLGIVLLFLVEAIEFIIFYSLNFDMVIITMALLSTFVLMALSMITYNNDGGGII